jgi:hypothetical protein
MNSTHRYEFIDHTFDVVVVGAGGARMVKKLRPLKGGSVPTFVGLGPVLHNKLAVDA